MTAIDDDSFRYVLKEDAALLANLAALWTVCPQLAADIEAVEPYPVEPSKSELPTVAVKVEDRAVYLHSRYEPLAEARKLIDPLDADRNLAFYVFGCGLGYHIELIFEKASSEALICVFEPDVRMLRTAFEHRDFSKLIDSRRVFFFTKADKSELMTRLTGHAALMAVGIAEVTHGSSQQIAPGFYAEVRKLLDEFASYSRTSLNTLVLNSRRTAENIARNIGCYLATPSMARLKDAYKGQPAIIVAAGPSLRKNKHLLKDVSDRAVVIAMQTTLAPLLEIGVEPRFVTALDYHAISTQFYEKLPPTLSAELIAEPKANAAILRAYPGPISVLGNTYAEGLLREMGLNKTRLQDGATVAHLAYYLADHLGCDPIIFVGQDLGFSDGLSYTPGTSHEDVWRPELSRFCSVEMKQWDFIVRERFILRRIPDYQGNPMYTEERLFTYLQQFERDFATARARIIDATEGGAAKRGATIMPLAQAIATFCTKPLSTESNKGDASLYFSHDNGVGVDSERVHEKCGDSTGNKGLMADSAILRGREHLNKGSRHLYFSKYSGKMLSCLRRRRDEAREIERISRQTLPLLEEIAEHAEDQPRVNRLIASIDALRARMNEFGPCYDLVTQLTQHTEFERFKTDRRISASKVNGVELQRKQVGRDIENVRGIMNAAVDFQTLMTEVIDLLGQDPENASTESTTRSLAA